MSDLTRIVNFLWDVLQYGGGIIAAVGAIRWVSGGKSHDAQQQESAVWVLLLGGVCFAIGAGMKGLLSFPSF